MKKIKNTIFAAIFTLSFSISTPTHASGIPTIDVASLTQTLINYLEMIEQTHTMLDSYANEIEQLRRIEVPGMDIINRINRDIQAYRSLAHRYNALATRYNSLKEFIDDLEYVESKISILCATGHTCTDDELRELNTQKLNISQNIISLLRSELEMYNSTDGQKSQFEQDIDESKERIENISTNFSNDTTEAQLNARMFEMLTVLTTEIVTLRKMIGEQRANDIQIKYTQTNQERAQLKNQIGNKYNPDNLKK